MARPQDQMLVTAQGKPAPQYYDTQTAKFEYLKGLNGANFVEDRVSHTLFNNLIQLVTDLKNESAEEDLIFIKKADAMPSVKSGLMVYVIDTSEVYVPYKGKWEVLR